LDTIEEIIKKYLGEKALEKIEQRLYERYQLSLNQCLFEFEKFDDVLREFFGDGAEGLEHVIFKSLKTISK
jgi:hypothetical protein